MNPSNFDVIPTERPLTQLLDSIDIPEQLRLLDEAQLPALANELRAFLLYTVGRTGGHFGAGLGVVELTIALHYVLNTPDAQLVWDVGHQTYPHKILTGRREQMASMRQLGGLAAFPNIAESPYDAFGVGHSSTSISAALGMALANTMSGKTHKAVAVIGDGAMTAGMAFEALNHCAHTRANMLIVLNDNTMSISKNVGGLAAYFERTLASLDKHRSNKQAPDTKRFDRQKLESLDMANGAFRGEVTTPVSIFEDLGLHYIGPIDGHHLPSLVQQLRNALLIPGPVLLHVQTKKGNGFSPAMANPVSYHSLTKLEPSKQPRSPAATAEPSLRTQAAKYQQIFGEWLCTTAEINSSLVGITPAMAEGSGMLEFSKEYPARFHDVAIAEQHALTFAAGLAKSGAKPVVGIYSTFLQRGYDQLIHDIALQNLDVTFGIDRAGFVGRDGPTHAGAFDISFLQCIPQLIIATPSDENACHQLLNSAFAFTGPACVRYPRGKGIGAIVNKTNQHWPIGKGLQTRTGKALCLLVFGVQHHCAMQLAEQKDYSVCDMRWAKPLDTELILNMAQAHDYIVTIEENAIIGGVGSSVTQLLMQHGVVKPVLNIGIEDRFSDQGSREEVLEAEGLSAQGMEQKITQWLELVN